MGKSLGARFLWPTVYVRLLHVNKGHTCCMLRTIVLGLRGSCVQSDVPFLTLDPGSAPFVSKKT